jgi:hypothetical protein
MFFSGCADQERQTEPKISTSTLAEAPKDTTVAQTIVTTTSGPTSTGPEEAEDTTSTIPPKDLNISCALDSDCASGCCAYLNGKHICASSSECKPKAVSEDECYAKQMNWCAGVCQRRACENCTKYLRCAVRTDENSKRQVVVETAEKNPERSGSCIYSGDAYENAAGEDGYCRQHKGTLVYAKCGEEPEAKDCASAYGYPSGHTYRIMHQRAFHGQGGDEYDLWCFICEIAG